MPVVALLHTEPADKQPVVPGAAVTPQTPTLAPAAFWHAPPQHSLSTAQMSPSCVQNEGLPLQTPPWQSFEQHSLFAAHRLPLVLHVVLSGVHVLLGPHTVPQHSEPCVHGWLSLMHKVCPHFPPVQFRLQQSVATAQLSPASLQIPVPPIGAPHVFVPGSQLTEQHSALDVHAVPTCTHAPASVLASASTIDASVLASASTIDASLPHPAPVEASNPNPAPKSTNAQRLASVPRMSPSTRKQNLPRCFAQGTQLTRRRGKRRGQRPCQRRARTCRSHRRGS
jgi:hypothetical protein